MNDCSISTQSLNKYGTVIIFTSLQKRNAKYSNENLNDVNSLGIKIKLDLKFSC